VRKIYVSSTFEDLKSFRERVSHVIRRMGDLDVAMEHYAAEDVRPLDRCLEDVAECDVYVGIFAWRYGFVPTVGNPGGLSITELEYQRAEELGKPRLVFLLHEDAPWPRKSIDKDPTQIERLRARVSDGTIAAFFNTEDSLAAEVSTALARLGPQGDVVRSFATLDVEKYFNALRQRYAHLDLDALTGAQRDEFLQLRLQSVYVEQHVRNSPPPIEMSKDLEERLLRTAELNAEDLPEGLAEDMAKSLRDFHEKYPARPVIEVLAEPENSRAIVLGHPGSGKSTLSRFLVLSLIDPAGDPAIRESFPDHLPIVIELKSYVALRNAGKCEGFLDFLARMGETEGWGLSKDAVAEYLGSGRPAMVVFDGLDEIFEPGERETITRQITGFANDYPSARIVATSRVLGYRRTILTNAGFVHLTLQDFEKEQVEEFARKWFAIAMASRAEEAEERIARITRAYESSPSIRQLAGVPMLLTIMAIIGKNQELPRERWKLYDHAAGVLVQHWDVNKHFKDQKLEADFLLEDDKKDLLRRLAWRMQSAKGGLAGNYIHRDELLSEFERYLRERFGQDAERAARIGREMVEQFRQRNYILSSLGANLYGFVHRAFLEYFCADAIVYRFEKTNTLTVDQMREDVFGAHRDDRAWHEVLRLVCGKIGEQYAGVLIQHLLECGSLLLAIECLLEVRNIAAISVAAERLADAAFEGLARGTLRWAGVERLLVLPQASTWTLHWLEKPSRADVRSPHYAGLVIAIAAQGSDEVRVVLERILATDADPYQSVAVVALDRGYADHRAIRELIQQAAKSAGPQTREHVCDVLGGYADREAVTILTVMSEDHEATVRAAAADALGGIAAETELGDAINSVVFRLALHDPVKDVRISAVHALARNLTADRMEMLREIARSDVSEDVREAARFYFRPET
jgi:Domain of unknown function (DUF4062)/HEAT repeats/NACHT domain